MRTSLYDGRLLFMEDEQYISLVLATISAIILINIFARIPNDPHEFDENT